MRHRHWKNKTKILRREVEEVAYVEEGPDAVENAAEAEIAASTLVIFPHQLLRIFEGSICSNFRR